MKPKGQTVTQNVDPATQAYVNQMRQYALGATGMPQTSSGQVAPGPFMGPNGIVNRMGAQQSGSPFQMPGLPQGITDAQHQYQQYAQGGNLGFSALTGNADAAQQFLNPFMSQLNPFFAQQRAGAVEGANQQATLAGAFGGDRSQIGAAVAGSQADQNQAGFNVQAFEDAMRRAGFAANLGYGASAQAAFLPQQYYGGQLGLLGGGMGPYGQTQTQHTQGDPFSQLLGLGLTAFGPGGLLAGGSGLGGLAGRTLSA
jgi:hypothetical protein